MTILAALLTACACCAGGVAFAADASTQDAPPDPFASVAAATTVLHAADGSPEATYRYRLVEPAPAASEAATKYPLIVFLHGAGERGDDNRAQLKHFAGWCASDAVQSRHPCFVLAMQCPAGETWAWLDMKAYRERGELPKQATEPTRAMRAVMQAIDEVLATKPIDPSRVYLTGLSMGGFGSFDLAARRPDLFAAVVPICGGGDPATAPRIAGIPLFIVHGSDDPVVPVELSRIMRDAVGAAVIGGAAAERERARGSEGAPQPMPKRSPNPMYREYDKVGHDSWTPAYRFGDEGVLDWLFAQRKTAAAGQR